MCSGAPAVIFLDADTVVARNMDEAFGCPGFCAVMRHSERLNSGVMVVTPSAATFRDMLSKIAQLPSYTGCVAQPLSRHPLPALHAGEGGIADAYAYAYEWGCTHTKALGCKRLCAQIRCLDCD